MHHQKANHGRQKIDVLTDCVDLGGFQRDCFFKCGFSSKKFHTWINHVAAHTLEGLSNGELARKVADPPGALTGPPTKMANASGMSAVDTDAGGVARNRSPQQVIQEDVDPEGLNSLFPYFNARLFWQ